MQTITTFLWFNDNAEEAVKFYTSVFKKSKIRKVVRYGSSAANASGRPPGSVMTIDFQLIGQEFVALNGGPHFKFTEAISLVVKCRTQKEVDYYWAKLSVGGEEGPCGWLKDKFGLSWQVVPIEMIEMLTGRN
jgi:predicted 3-demethylubiquinone-9 3-methyltransferase (glyoxalase superfamily)